MAADELQRLSILDVLENEQQTSQRAIAAATGINLAKVNFCLKKLIEKGHVKLRNVSRNPNKLKYLYIVTPSGLREKSRLTVAFLKRTAETYNRAEAKILDNLRAMHEQGVSRVALVGNGDVAEILVRLLEDQATLSLVGVYSREDEALAGQHFDRVVLVEPDQFDEDLAHLATQGVSEDKIWLLR